MCDFLGNTPSHLESLWHTPSILLSHSPSLISSWDIVFIYFQVFVYSTNPPLPLMFGIAVIIPHVCNDLCCSTILLYLHLVVFKVRKRLFDSAMQLSFAICVACFVCLRKFFFFVLFFKLTILKDACLSSSLAHFETYISASLYNKARNKWEQRANLPLVVGEMFLIFLQSYTHSYGPGAILLLNYTKLLLVLKYLFRGLSNKLVCLPF